jgi:hypothetical protein
LYFLRHSFVSSLPNLEKTTMHMYEYLCELLFWAWSVPLSNSVVRTTRCPGGVIHPENVDANLARDGPGNHNLSDHSKALTRSRSRGWSPFASLLKLRALTHVREDRVVRVPHWRVWNAREVVSLFAGGHAAVIAPSFSVLLAATGSVCNFGT